MKDKLNVQFRIQHGMVNMLFFVLLSLFSFLVFYLVSRLEFFDKLFSNKLSSIIPVTFVLLPFSLFVNQDNVNSSGVVNRLFDIQIVSNKTSIPANSFRCLLRNLSFFIPFDIIFWIVSPTRSIGDYIAGTKLIKGNGSFHYFQKYRFIDYMQYFFNSLLISVLIASIVPFLISSEPYVSESSLYQVERLNDSTEIQRKYFDNGNLNIEYTMVNGKYNGFYKEWDKDGNFQSSIEYSNGVRNGITTTFYSNGTKESEVLYSNNEFVKYVQRWDRQGNLLETIE